MTRFLKKYQKKLLKGKISLSTIVVQSTEFRAVEWVKHLTIRDVA